MKSPTHHHPFSEVRPDQMERVRGGFTVVVCLPLHDVFGPPSATPVTPRRPLRSGPPTFLPVVDPF